MKKTVIGIAFLFCGVILTIGILLTAAQCIPQSSVYFLLSAVMSDGSYGADGFGLGVFFIAGIAMSLFGLVVLIIEYFKRN